MIARKPPREKMPVLYKRTGCTLEVVLCTCNNFGSFNPSSALWEAHYWGLLLIGPVLLTGKRGSEGCGGSA